MGMFETCRRYNNKYIIRRINSLDFISVNGEKVAQDQLFGALEKSLQLETKFYVRIINKTL